MPGCGPPPFDLDASGALDADDLRLLLINYATAEPSADLDSSGTVDLADLRLLLAAFGIEQTDYPRKRKFRKALNRMYKSAINEGMDRTKRERKQDKKILRELARSFE